MMSLNLIGVLLWFYSYMSITIILFLNCIGLLAYIFYQSTQLVKEVSKTNILINDSNKVKAAFLANMSHEIRTPLNAINGFSEILAHTTDASEKNYLIKNIRKNTYELTNFIDNILDISKIEFGRIHLDNQNVSLSSIVSQTKETMEARAQAKGLIFKIESIGKLPTHVYLDESRIQQILINLIGNAIKFTDTGFVKLQIEAEFDQSNQLYLLFTIIDTGIGISEPDQMDLFQSFSQADDSNTRRYGGIGLGLALSRRLAQQFLGDVLLLKSQINVGSAFCLRVPLENLNNIEWKEHLFLDLSTSSVQLNLPIDIDITEKKVLLVEDSEDNREIFKHFLKSMNLYVDTAENGEIAITKLIQSDYDFILMDIQLPIIDGLEATRMIRSMGYLKPIIALTAHASFEAKMSCLRAGCTDIITKPVTQTSLLQNILFILEDKKLDGTTNDITKLHT